jgi:alkylation response protein AidB-like acyl-CoA dehydrogenase
LFGEKDMTNSFDSLVGRAVELRPLLREHAPTADADRRLTDAVNTALTEAGLFALTNPKRFGGQETDLRTVLSVTEALGVADGSAAWLVAVGAAAGWLAGQFSEQARQEVFGAASPPRFAGANTENPARKVDSGLRLTGRWAFSSGADRASWATLGSAVADESGQLVGAAMSLVPVAELTLEHTWRTVGMRATASETWVADDVFVPEYRVLPLDAVFAGQHPFPLETPMHRLPLAPVATLPLLGPILGAARAALDLVVAKAPTKGMHHTFFARQTDSVGVHIQIGEAAMKLESARLLGYAVADELDAAAGQEEPMAYRPRARMRAQLAHAAQLALAAIDTLINVHGAGTFAEVSSLQQFWRDANTAARHAALNPVVGYEVLGKDLLGIQELISPSV